MNVHGQGIGYNSIIPDSNEGLVMNVPSICFLLLSTLGQSIHVVDSHQSNPCSEQQNAQSNVWETAVSYPTADECLVIGTPSVCFCAPAAQVVLHFLVLHKGLPGVLLRGVLYPPGHPSMPAPKAAFKEL